MKGVKNLRTADLHKANLSGLNLEGVDFSKAKLEGGANLSKTNLRGADPAA